MSRNSKAFTIERLRAEFENQRWELLETVYRPKTAMKARCPEGHLTTKRTSDLRRGEITGKGLVCGICSPPGLRKLTIEFVREECKTRAGMTVLSTEYVDCGTPLEMLCPENHRIWKTWDSIKAGEGCGVCAGNAKNTIEFVKKESKKLGWKVLSNEYINCGTPLDVECSNGHQTQKSWDSIKNGTQCLICTGRQKYSYEQVCAMFLEQDLKVLSKEYKNAHSPIKYWCEIGNHQHQMSLKALMDGQGCGKCRRPDKTEIQKESFRLSRNLVNGLVRALKGSSFNGSKSGFCRELADQVIERIGPRPNPIYEGDVKKTFHLDHCVPRDWFNHTSQEQIELCWHSRNFQWLVDRDNIAKNNRLAKEMMLQLTPYQICIANLAEFRPKRQEALMKKLGLWMTPKEAAQKLKKHQTPEGSAVQLELVFKWSIAS